MATQSKHSINLRLRQLNAIINNATNERNQLEDKLAKVLAREEARRTAEYPDPVTASQLVNSILRKYELEGRRKFYDSREDGTTVRMKVTNVEQAVAKQIASEIMAHPKAAELGIDRANDYKSYDFRGGTYGTLVVFYDKPRK